MSDLTIQEAIEKGHEMVREVLREWCDDTNPGSASQEPTTREIRTLMSHYDWFEYRSIQLTGKPLNISPYPGGIRNRYDPATGYLRCKSCKEPKEEIMNPSNGPFCNRCLSQFRNLHDAE